MKTILLEKYTTRLANLNDQLCFFQFNRKELDKRLLEFGPKVNDLFTTDLFSTNSMAPRIHVKIGELPSFQDQNQKFTFGSYISTSYEVFSYYLKDSLDLLSKINSTTYRQTNDNQIEEKYNLTLGSSGIPMIQSEIINTIKYFRLRRNHFTHLSEVIDTQLNDLISNQGSVLNTFWSHTINKLDFTCLSIFTFGEQETIEILKLLRIITEILDLNLSPNLSHHGIAEYLAQNEYSSITQWKNIDLISQRTKKIKDLALRHFDVNIANYIIEPKVGLFGSGQTHTFFKKNSK
jgi:hypothetical protein